MMNTLGEIREFLFDIEEDYEQGIKGDNPAAFTRNRKLTPLPLQMFGQKGKTQHSELLDFYKDIDKPLDISTVGFFQSRMKFNDAAIRTMSNDFITDMYDKHDGSMVKLNGYIVAAMDGSKIILPSTPENEAYFGKMIPSNAEACNYPVMGMFSTMYDCINKMILDIRVGDCRSSERNFASLHLETAKENFRQKMISVFDRGYYSIRLVDQMQD